MDECVVMCIFNRKGGVGKTTTAVHLAGILAYKDYQVLIIDTDTQGGVAACLGMSVSDSDLTLFEVASGICQPQEAIHETYITNLKVIPCTNKFKILKEKNTINKDNENKYFKEIVHSLKPKFNFIIIDTYGDRDAVISSVLLAAYYLIIPVQPNALDAKGILDVMEDLDEMRSEYIGVASILGILITMVDRRQRMVLETINILRTNLSKVFSVEIPSSAKVREASAYGRIVYDYCKTAAASRAYEAFTQEVLDSLRTSYGHK